MFPGEWLDLNKHYVTWYQLCLKDFWILIHENTFIWCFNVWNVINLLIWSLLNTTITAVIEKQFNSIQQEFYFVVPWPSWCWKAYSSASLCMSSAYVVSKARWAGSKLGPILHIQIRTTNFLISVCASMNVKFFSINWLLLFLHCHVNIYIFNLWINVQMCP